MEGVGQPNLTWNQVAVLATLVEEDNDAILVELCDRLEERVSVRCLSSNDGAHRPKTQAHARKKTLRAPCARHGTSAAVASGILA